MTTQPRKILSLLFRSQIVCSSKTRGGFDHQIMADYTRLATLISTRHELAIVRDFAALKAKNLLYLQAELVHLEAELANIESENKFSGDSERLGFQTSLFDLKESSATKKDLQWRKALEVRKKLKEYSKNFPETL